MLSNLKAYVGVRAGEVREIPLPVKLKAQVVNDMMDPGEQLAWRTWDYVNQWQPTYANRYACLAGSAQLDAYILRWKRSGKLLETTSFGGVPSSGKWGFSSNSKTRQGEWIPIHSPLSAD